MSRVEGVPARRNPLVRLTYALARCEVERMTGKALLTPTSPSAPTASASSSATRMLEKSVASQPARGRAPARAGGAEVGGHAGL